MVFSGLLYMFYRYPQSARIQSLNIESLGSIAILHTAGAFFLISFIIVHVYLITTGHTPTSNLKAMITGYEEIEHEGTIRHQSEQKHSSENVIEAIK